MGEQLHKWEINAEQHKELIQYRTFCNRIDRFRKHSTLQTFQEIFGTDAERLIFHYRQLGTDFERFLTYLTRDQINTVLSYIIKNYQGD